ncbi:MAG TPA: hypothetical protein IGS52_22185 [Oscillatoriaceae cyanobacterium M33_DOE_052]|uniref:Uncharacterized protein n=1 Tax=Planktothricoides sp. SpSt-374 TaxID=2282167 RepID=A0A7C3ZI56_9CYAN|nr:hypothetical protein [Oscillatoriaceae cyanobacterium M33_DOE_052]
MKYFFLTEGWKVGRVWGVQGEWNSLAWRREPEIERLKVSISETDEILWLYRVEDAVIMVEVKPEATVVGAKNIGQVMLKRLMSAEQVIDRLGASEAVCQISRGTLQG